MKMGGCTTTTTQQHNNMATPAAVAAAAVAAVAADAADAADAVDDEDDKVYDIRTAYEMLQFGLQLVKWTETKINRVKKSTANRRLRSEYGADPHVCAQIYEDLQTIGDLTVDDPDKSLKHFFMAMHFLKRHPTEDQRETKWQLSKNTLRPICWGMIERIRSLLKHKIGWPSDNFGDDIWVMSVDGTHLRTEEPGHPEFPKDKSYFSFKHHCAGFDYEIGLALYESKLCWFNGPIKAGENDISIFQKRGLKAKLLATKKMVIGDGGYRGYANLISTPNSHDDTDEVYRFKSRARQRHERYNGMLKEFDCLKSLFRHDRDCLQACFEAVAVVVQYKMEMGTPLYEI